MGLDKVLSSQQMDFFTQEIARIWKIKLPYFNSSFFINNYLITFNEANSKITWEAKCELLNKIIFRGAFEDITTTLMNIKNLLDGHTQKYLPAIAKLPWPTNYTNRYYHFKIMDDYFGLKYTEPSNGKICIEVLTSRKKFITKIDYTILDEATVDRIILNATIYINKREDKKARGSVHPIYALSAYLNENGIKSKVKLKAIIFSGKLSYILIKFNKSEKMNGFTLTINGRRHAMRLEDPNTFSHIRSVVSHMIHEADTLASKMMGPGKHDL